MTVFPSIKYKGGNSKAKVAVMVRGNTMNAYIIRFYTFPGFDICQMLRDRGLRTRFGQYTAEWLHGSLQCDTGDISKREISGQV